MADHRSEPVARETWALVVLMVGWLLLCVVVGFVV